MREILNASKDQINDNDNCAAAGPPGVGKTTQFGTLPGKKFLYVFDANCLPSIRGMDIDFADFIPDIKDINLNIQTLKKGIGDKSPKNIDPTSYVEWSQDFDERCNSGFFDEYDWIGFDSCTTFNDMIMDRVQALNHRLGKHPEMADYTASMNAMRQAFRAVTAVNCNLWVTIHTEMMKDEVTGAIGNQLVLTGKNRVRIPLMFSNIFMLSGGEKEGKAAYEARSVPDRRNPAARTNLKTMEIIQDVTIDFSKPLEDQGIGGFFKREGRGLRINKHSTVPR